MKTIDVETIMQEIRDEIKEKGYKASDLSFNDIPNNYSAEETTAFSMEELENCKFIANNASGLNYYQPVGGGLKGFIKKVIRKLLAPIVAPLCQKQEIYNSNSIRTINQLTEYVKSLEKRLAELEANK